MFLPELGARAYFQTLYLPVYCEEDPPQPPFSRGENPIKVPLLKGDLGGSPGLKTRPRGQKSTFARDDHEPSAHNQV